MTIENWFMLCVRISSYGYSRKVAKHEGGVSKSRTRP